MNARIDQIEQRNRDAWKAIARFREQNAEVDRRDLGQRQQAAPYFGLVPCEAAGIDFVMFHAHDDVVAREYLWHGADGYEPETVRTWVEWCRSGGIVLDIGAYSGLMSILAARANSANEVHLFEPVARTIERANVNVKLNGLGKRIKRHCVAASSRARTTEICLYRDADFLGTGNSIEPKESIDVVDRTTIRTVPLDDYLGSIRPIAVKIDVEGHELDCLRGMRRMLIRARPRMIIEIWEKTRVDVVGFMESVGYRMNTIGRPERGVSNWIATPVEVSEDSEISAGQR